MGRTQACIFRLFGAALLAGSVSVAGPVLSHAAAGVGTSTAVTITSSANPAGFGELVILNATVLPATGTVMPTGSVSFVDGGRPLATVALDSNGQAALSESTLAVGSHSIVAAYAGDATFLASSSSALQQLTTIQTSSTTIFSTISPAVFGQSVVFVVTVMAGQGSAVPGGSVVLLDGAAGLATVPLDSTGTAVATSSTLAVGTHTITARYLGDAGFSGSSGSLTETITAAATSVGLTSSPNPSALGQPVTFTATVAAAPGTVPSGSISFFDGAAPVGTAPLDVTGIARLTISSLSTGTHPIAATYAGDGNVSGGTSPVVRQEVGRMATSTSLRSSANPAAFSAPVTFTATVTPERGGAPTGWVTFADGASTLGTVALDGSANAVLTTINLGLGPHSISAGYSGDPLFAGSAANLDQWVSGIATTTSLDATPNPAGVESPVTFVASVAGGYGVVPSGSVTFLDGTVGLGSATLDAGGRASLTTSTLRAGSHQVVAVASPADPFAPSTSPVLVEVVIPVSSAVSLSSSANPSALTSPVTLTAVVTASAAGTLSGSITFFDGTGGLGSVALDHGAASLTITTLAAGPHSLTAAYGGDVNHAAARSEVLHQIVTQAISTTALSVAPNPAETSEPVVLRARVTSAAGQASGTVTFLDGSTSVGTAELRDGTATLTTNRLGRGRHSLSAVYGGDGSVAGSRSATIVVRVSGGDDEQCRSALEGEPRAAAPTSDPASARRERGHGSNACEDLDEAVAGSTPAEDRPSAEITADSTLFPATLPDPAASAPSPKG